MGPRGAGEVIYVAENTKSIKTLGVGGLHRFSDPVAGPRAQKPHLHSQHFGVPVLAVGGRPRELRAPRLLLDQGPSEPCYATVRTRSSIVLLLNSRSNCCISYQFSIGQTGRNYCKPFANILAQDVCSMLCLCYEHDVCLSVCLSVRLSDTDCNILGFGYVKM